MTLRPLTEVETRVLGTLMEKARTVPDTYPMTLNSIVTGCNQKSSRDPLLELGEADVQDALDTLKALTLVFQTSGARVTRWEHNFQRAVGVPEQSAVLLGLMLLRGPQTSGELRINSERWYRFADISSVEGFLHEMAERPVEKGGPLVVHLPRAPGAREQRWAHLMCGPVGIDVSSPTGAQAHGVPAGLELRVCQLESEVRHLRAALEDLCTQLGVTPTPAEGMSPPGQFK